MKGQENKSRGELFPLVKRAALVYNFQSGFVFEAGNSMGILEERRRTTGVKKNE